VAAPEALGQTITNANALTLRSTGAAVTGTNAWTLDQNGYLGTYVTLQQPGTVAFTLNARGAADAQMGLAVGDSRATFNVENSTSTFTDYTTNLSLSAGTHFVRVDYGNDDGAAGGRALTVRRLTVGTNAIVANSHTDANALAASDTYVANYRKGTAAVTLRNPDGTPMAANTQVRLKLRNHAFTFGNSAPGFNAGYQSPDWWISGNTPDGQQFREKFLQNFNAIVPENAGKWNAVEYNKGQVDQARLDAVVGFARDNGLRVRGHTHVWPSPDGLPPFANQLLTDATDPNKTQAQRDAAKAAFRAALSERVGYTFSGNRGADYMEFDVLSEAGGRHFQYDANNPPPAAQQPLLQNRLWTAYGATGQAAMFEEVAAAMRANGGQAKLMIDDFNVLQWNTYNGTTTSDGGFANNYRRHIESVAASLSAQSRAQLGVGMQYYADASPTADQYSPHSVARMLAVMQNLSGTGAPLSLSGFGVNTAASEAEAATILADTLRMTFGTASMQSYWHWGMWAGDVWPDFPAGVLYDRNWNLTQSGKVWQQMMGIKDWGLAGVPVWTTDQTLQTDAQGRVNLTGFYGAYDVIVGGQTFSMDLAKGVDSYVVTVPEPSAVVGVAGALSGLLLKRRRTA
jgi:hypothetical protein